MHMPDGYLALTIALPAFIITVLFWAIALKKIKLTEQQVPMMGLLTALFFAAMFMNFPLIGPTTAHLLGGAAIGLILGPFAGLISMSIILVLQALLFADGGLVVLGANVLNIGVIGVFVPCLVFLGLCKLTKPKTTRILFPIIFVSAFLGDVSAAIAAGAQVGLSNILPLYGLNVAVPVMALNHSIIGVAEGFVTVVLIATLLRLRPDVLAKSPMLGRFSMFHNKNEVEE